MKFPQILATLTEEPLLITPNAHAALLKMFEEHASLSREQFTAVTCWSRPHERFADGGSEDDADERHQTDAGGNHREFDGIKSGEVGRKCGHGTPPICRETPAPRIGSLAC